MNRIQRSWLLLKSSLQVIFRNKILLVFPILIFTLTLVIALFFLVPFVLRPTGYPYTQAGHWVTISDSLFHSQTITRNHQTVTVEGLTPLAIVCLCVMYFVSMFCATFFNVAFYHEIMFALGGKEVSIGRGLQFACKRWKAVLMWTLFAGLVGLLIKLIEERLAFVGQLLARIIGLAWSVASVFVIPAIVCDEEITSPVELLKQSAIALKKTWGETLIGYVGLKFANAIGVIALLVVVAGGFFGTIATKDTTILIAAVVLGVLAFIGWSYVINVASQIYKAALFLFASEGIVAEPYSEELLNMAWKHKAE